MTRPSDIAGLSERLNDAEGVGACLSGDPQFIKALCKEAATALDSLSARVKEFEVENERLRTAIKVDREVDAQSRDEDRRRLNELRRRAEQQRDEAYERAAKVAEEWLESSWTDEVFAARSIATAIRRLASGPEGGSEGEK